MIVNSEQKNWRGTNKNVVATICHNEYQDVLLDNKCIRHAVNLIQSKGHRTGTYKIGKISLSCFDGKIISKTMVMEDELSVTIINYKKQLPE